MADENAAGCEFSREKLILHLDLSIPGDVQAIDPVVE